MLDQRIETGIPGNNMHLADGPATTRQVGMEVERVTTALEGYFKLFPGG
jgi:hypothetical protein